MSSPQSGVYVNGLPVAVIGSIVSPHGPDKKKHVGVKTTATCSVYVSCSPITRAGDVDTCGDKRIGGSPNVQIGR